MGNVIRDLKTKTHNFASKKIAEYEMEIGKIKRELRNLKVAARDAMERADEYHHKRLMKDIRSKEDDIKSYKNKIALLKKAKDYTSEKDPDAKLKKDEYDDSSEE